MSVVMRRTPRAITAMPPITIHGTPVALSALARSARARSSSSPRLRLLGTLLNPRPTATHLKNCRLVDWIARTWPQPHRSHRVRGCNGFRDGLRWTRTVMSRHRTTALSRELLPSFPSSYCRCLVAFHDPYQDAELSKLSSHS